MESYDFSGWATRNNLKCSDGRTIMRDAFKDNDGRTVPLVWNHEHNDPFSVLGHAMLENKPEGVYAYCKFNDTESGQNAKLLVQHGDVVALSIYANQLKQQNGNVYHGAIREVSLVLAGANPGAFIDSIIKHDDGTDEEAIIYSGEEDIILAHAEEENKPELKEKKEEPKMAEKTVKDVFDEMTEEQKTVVYAMIGQALEDAGVDIDDEDKKEDETPMKHNVFDMDEEMKDNVLSHSEMNAIFSDAKRYGSLKDSVLAHGINNIDYLFPEAQSLNTPPDFITRDMGWVQKVMNSVHHTPFSRIKSMFANLTEDDARAKGYIKGKLKKDEVFGLLKRTTTPTTIYKKQKLDRDDVVDITDFDVVAWLKYEMRMMLDEEIARAILVGDGRTSGSDDKINESNIRPIWTDEDLYTIKSIVNAPKDATAAAVASEFIDQAVRARKDYKGSGSPKLFIAEELLTECLLLKDVNGRRIYKDINELATAMMVSEIVVVPVMEGLKRTGSDGIYHLKGIIVNMNDYNVGADKGGAVNMFDDFDIDYNAQKYLIETRCSGALIKPYSAIVLETKETA